MFFFISWQNNIFDLFHRSLVEFKYFKTIFIIGTILQVLTKLTMSLQQNQVPAWTLAFNYCIQIISAVKQSIRHHLTSTTKTGRSPNFSLPTKAL